MEKSNCKAEGRELSGYYVPLERCIGPQQLKRSSSRRDGKRRSRALYFHLPQRLSPEECVNTNP